MTASRLAVLASGSGTNLAAVLDACAGGRIDGDVVLVVSNRQDAFALTRAAAAGVVTEYMPLKPYRSDGRTRQDYDADLAAAVAACRPDWIVLAGWMHILSSAFLARFPGMVVNLHPSLPGAYKGPDGIAWAFEAYERGEITATGAMTHLVPDEGVDSGPVLDTIDVAIEPGDTIESLATRMHAAEHELLVRTLAGLCAGKS